MAPSMAADDAPVAPSMAADAPIAAAAAAASSSGWTSWVICSVMMMTAGKKCESASWLDGDSE